VSEWGNAVWQRRAAKLGSALLPVPSAIGIKSSSASARVHL
jgi:hypothetical protein